MSAHQIDWTPYRHRPRPAPNAEYGNMVDIISYDHLPAPVRKALRESPYAILAAETLAWMRTGVSVDRVVAHIRGLNDVGYRAHWQKMKQDGNALIRDRSR